MAAATDDGRESRQMQLMLQNQRMIIVMVGLPARGKSYMAKKILRYLLHLKLKAKIVNLGSYRRNKTKDTTVGQTSSSFFDPSNKKNLQLRDEICCEGLSDLINWWTDGGQVGIFDATNVSIRRRDLIRNFLQQQAPVCPFDIESLYVESICNDDKVIENNIINAKLKNPDYCTVERDSAIRDFWERIKMYELDYQKVQAKEGSYIKVIDVGNDVVGHSIHNYLSLRILYFLMHLNLHRKTFENELLRKKPLISQFSPKKTKNKNDTNNNNNNNNNNEENNNESQSSTEEIGANVVPLHPFMRRSSFLLWNEGSVLTPRLPPSVTPREVTNKSIIPEDMDTDDVNGMKSPSESIISPLQTQTPQTNASDTNQQQLQQLQQQQQQQQNEFGFPLPLTNNNSNSNTASQISNLITSPTSQYYPSNVRSALDNGDGTAHDQSRIASTAAASAVAMATFTASQHKEERKTKRTENGVSGGDDSSLKGIYRNKPPKVPITNNQRVMPNLLPVQSPISVESVIGTQQQITPHTRRVRPSVTRTSTVLDLIKRRKESVFTMSDNDGNDSNSNISDKDRRDNMKRHKTANVLMQSKTPTTSSERDGDSDKDKSKNKDKTSLNVTKNDNNEKNRLGSPSIGHSKGSREQTPEILTESDSENGNANESSNQGDNELESMSSGHISEKTKQKVIDSVKRRSKTMLEAIDSAQSMTGNSSGSSSHSIIYPNGKRNSGKNLVIEKVKERMKKNVEKAKHFDHDEYEKDENKLQKISRDADSSVSEITKSSFMELDKASDIKSCSIISCNTVFDDKHKKYLCRLCNRIICGKCSRKVPAKGHPNVKIRICDICLFETDSENDLSDDDDFVNDTTNDSTLQMPQASSKDAAISETLIDGIASIDQLLTNLNDNSKDKIKLELLKISQQLGDVVKSLQMAAGTPQVSQTSQPSLT